VKITFTPASPSHPGEGGGAAGQSKKRTFRLAVALHSNLGAGLSQFNSV